MYMDKNRVSVQSKVGAGIGSWDLQSVGNFPYINYMEI